LFYSVMGIPIARWADRGNRITIISVTTLLWSVAVILCGVVRSLCSAVDPHSGGGGRGRLHSDCSFSDGRLFTRAERPRAVARYMMGGSLSLVMAIFWRVG